ncbi:MAG: hypothetical protein KF760_06315 [Candidatus Eremiobacteraeota bacterium]|nr:hypothetical protein [Candidatus Eremiobacteraeota bacterium]MCW5866129.1 hypothetical protein [Candidatus Eremiobacteraeota bacterium]
MGSVAGVEKFFYLGLAVVGVVVLAASAYGLIVLKRMGVAVLQSGPKKPKALPKHKVDSSTVDSRWPNEEAYNRMLSRLHQELQQAVHQQDKETIETIAQGPALRLFLARLGQMDMAVDQREALQGSIRQSWDASSSKLVVVLAVSRWNKGWRRYYEEWTLQRQGNAYFVVDARPTRL